MEIHDKKIEALNSIIRIIEQKYNVTVETDERNGIMHELNKFYGASYNFGMQEGIKVNSQITDLKKK